MHKEIEKFENEVADNIAKMNQNKALLDIANKWHDATVENRYTYNFKWMDRPIIQEPQDIIAMQELIWRVKPDLIIETGIAHGGSILFSASMLALLDMELDRKDSMVIGIDIDIRVHNHVEILSRKVSRKIHMIEGSSIDPAVVSEVNGIASKYQNVLVCLDSNHTHDHVLAELKAYAPLVSVDSYCVVFDTGIEYLPKGSCKNRPWDVGNNPMTAVNEFMKDNALFTIDRRVEEKVLITNNPGGFLRRIA